MVCSTARVVSSGKARHLLSCFFFRLLEGLDYIPPPVSSQGDASLIVLSLCTAHRAILGGLQLRKSDTVVGPLQLRSIRPSISSGETGEYNTFY